MEYNAIGWFEIPVTDMDRAEKFYEELLGYKLDRQEEKDGHLMSWFPMKENAMGAPGTLMRGEAYKPSHEGTIVYFTAPKMDEMLERVEGLGGKVLAPKKDIGEYGYIAWVEDTEGNRIALHMAKAA